MKSKRLARLAKWMAAAAGVSAASYATYVGVAFLRYGKTKGRNENDTLLNVFMPDYEVADRHNIGIAAPAHIVLSAACEMNLGKCAVIRGIFKGRELILRSKPDSGGRPEGFLPQMKSLGWRVLAETPDREIVMGAVTKPWEPNPVFRGLAPDEFASFGEPGYVKIIWTLRADPVDGGRSVFRVETRAVATDAEARRKFRRYWSFLSPGIIAIRRVMLPLVKAESERRWRVNAA